MTSTPNHHAQERREREARLHLHSTCAGTETLAQTEEKKWEHMVITHPTPKPSRPRRQSGNAFATLSIIVFGFACITSGLSGRLLAGRRRILVTPTPSPTGEEATAAAATSNGDRKLRRPFVTITTGHAKSDVLRRLCRHVDNPIPDIYDAYLLACRRAHYVQQRA
jgi:hypothetical protein